MSGILKHDCFFLNKQFFQQMLKQLSFFTMNEQFFGTKFKKKLIASLLNLFNERTNLFNEQSY